jgi:hypothetical protein
MAAGVVGWRSGSDNHELSSAYNNTKCNGYALSFCFLGIHLSWQAVDRGDEEGVVL